MGRGASSFMGPIDKQADVVVIGGGIAGCATAYNLAKRGASVVLVEKGEIAGEQSGRNWGWVSQMRSPAEAPLHILSHSVWPKLSDELNSDLEWVKGGGMYLAEDEESFARMQSQAVVMGELGMDVRALARGEVETLIPEIAGSWVGAYYNRNNGHADPVKTTTAFARAAQEYGVKIYTDCAAEHIEVSNGVVSSVVTERGEIQTSVVVCAAGAWSAKLGRMVGLDLPQKKVRATVARTRPVPIFTKINVWGGGVAVRQRIDGSLMIAGDGSSDYDITLESFRHLRMFLPTYFRDRRGIRLHVGAELLKDMVRSMPWSASKKRPFAHTVGVEPRPNSKKVGNSLRSLVKLYPHLEGTVQIERAWAGYIDGTPDRVPVLGEVPGVKGFLFATGFSGHGFSLGPGVGVVMSELIVDGKMSVDVHGLRYSRFAERDLNQEL